MSDQFPFTAVSMSDEEDTDEVYLGEYGGGGGGGVVVLVPIKELRVTQGETVWVGVYSALTVLSGAEEEEETNPGEVTN